jgi:sortase A
MNHRNSENHTVKKHRRDGVKFIFYPILLFILTAVLFLAVIVPVLSPYRDLLGVILLDRVPQFGDDRQGLFSDALSEQRSYSQLPYEGEEYGSLSIPSAGIDVPLIYGDSPAELRRGVGTYTGTWVPGQGHTVLLAGHNNNFFRTLPDVKKDDLVTIKTNSGKFVYRITGARTARFDDKTAYDLYKEEENLIMYTCHNSIPFGATPWRLFVYGAYVADMSEPLDLGAL